MAYKIMLDFENDMIEFDIPSQKGMEHYVGLSEKKDEILKVLGYEQVDLSNVVNLINSFTNGGMIENELLNELEKECENQ